MQVTKENKKRSLVVGWWFVKERKTKKKYQNKNILEKKKKEILEKGKTKHLKIINMDLFFFFFPCIALKHLTVVSSAETFFFLLQ